MMGKIIGALVGFGLGVTFGNAAWALVGANLGLLLGHLLLDRDDLPLPKTEIPPSKAELLGTEPLAPTPVPAPRETRRGPMASPDETHLAQALCPLFIEVARADTTVSQPEIRVAREFFQLTLKFSEGGMEEVRLALKAALAADPQPIEALVKAARTQVIPPMRLEVVHALYELGLADGILNRGEQDALKQAVQHFNLSEEQLRDITARHLGTGQEHYARLGLLPTASDDEIRAAFRKLATEHHPDRASSLGEREQAAAGEKFRQIKAAFDQLRILRGL